MLALFAFSVLSFLLLFGAVIRLLHRAKADGVRRTRRAANSEASVALSRPQASSFTLRRRPEGTSPLTDAPLSDESLSKLVPGKQTDWRFMVRERRGRLRRAASVPSEATNIEDKQRPGRSDWAYYNENMGDLSDPAASSRSGVETRRAG